MKALNQFQFKSLSNLSFDLAKAWFVAGVIAPIGVFSLSLLNRTILFTVGIVASWFFIKLGLSLGREVRE